MVGVYWFWEFEKQNYLWNQSVFILCPDAFPVGNYLWRGRVEEGERRSWWLEIGRLFYNLTLSSK